MHACVEHGVDFFIGQHGSQIVTIDAGVPFVVVFLVGDLVIVGCKVVFPELRKDRLKLLSRIDTANVDQLLEFVDSPDDPARGSRQILGPTAPT